MKTQRSLIGGALLLILAIASQMLLAADDPAQPPSIESKYLSHIRQLTSDFAKAGEGYFSPDGKTIIFQAVPREYMFYQIYTLALPDGKPKLVSTGRGRTTCSYFAPDGKSIIFASSHLDPN